MAAAVPGVVRASFDADAVVALQVRLADATLEIVGREDVIALKAFAGGPDRYGA